MADFTELTRLAQLLEEDPQRAEFVANVNPQAYELVMRLAAVPLMKWRPFGDPVERTCQFGPLLSMHKHRWAVTGNRCGKTEMGIAEDIFDCQLVDPVTRGASRRFNEPIEMWIVSDNEEASINIAQKKVAELLGPQDGLGWQWVKDSSHYSEENGFRNNACAWTNGSRIDFKYSSQGRNSFQGTKKHKIHHDEEQPQPIFRECRARLVDFGGHFLGTFTPVYDEAKGMPWIYEELYLDRDSKNVEFYNWSLFDNPHIPEAEKQQLIQDWDEDEREVRIHGAFVPVGMRLAFSSRLQRECKKTVRAPQVGDLVEDVQVWPDGSVHTSVEFVPDQVAA